MVQVKISWVIFKMYFHDLLAFHLNISKRYKKNCWDHRHLLKKRHVEAYQSPFINENVNTEIMKKSQLRNTFLSPKNDAVRKPKT